MALDPLEKERLRQRMADRMRAFLETSQTVSSVSAHYYDDLHGCELCGDTHTQQCLVIKNRAGKKMLIALECLKEMVKFRVVDVEDLTKWLEKLSELKADAKKRKADEQAKREEEVKKLEKRVIVRKRPADPVA
jgi:hypothetical protein